ncbi:MAG: menaquinone biosynthesis protein [Planctomycetes bacterium]|nr:menaquinone biosynthesis protein [Planctomycetota bacterium]
MLRTGVVSFLNAQPLWVDLQGDPQFEIVAAPPAQLADMMAAGKLDLGLLPSFEALKLPNVELLTDLGVAADGAVESVGLFAQPGTNHAKSLLIDGDSRTSAALVRIVLKAIGENPMIATGAIAAENVPTCGHEAAMLIGDKCLKARALWPQLMFLDLASAWKELTELPFVFAVWTARPGVLSGHIQGRLHEALVNGREKIAALAEAAREATHWSTSSLTRYLGETIKHRLDERCRNGLREFARRCVADGLLPPGCEKRVG